LSRPSSALSPSKGHPFPPIARAIHRALSGRAQEAHLSPAVTSTAMPVTTLLVARSPVPPWIDGQFCRRS
jgi:hypothetical protein